MQQTEEPAAESETQCFGMLYIEGEARIVEPQFLDGFAQRLELALLARTGIAGCGVEVAEDHLLRLLVAGKRFGCRCGFEGDRVTDANVLECLDGRHEVPDLGVIEFRHLDRLRGVPPQFGDVPGAAAAHHLDLVTRAE